MPNHIQSFMNTVTKMATNTTLESTTHEECKQFNLFHIREPNLGITEVTGIFH